MWLWASGAVKGFEERVCDAFRFLFVPRLFLLGLAALFWRSLASLVGRFAPRWSVSGLCLFLGRFFVLVLFLLLVVCCFL